MATGFDKETQEYIEAEIKEVKAKILENIDGVEIISLHTLNVQVSLKRTKHKQVTVKMQFPRNYPKESILTELKSSVLPPKLLNRMMELCDQEMKKHVGKQQVFLLVLFLRKFLDENPLIVCSEELAYVKDKLITHKDQFKVKQKTGVISICINQNSYFMNLKLTIPDDYPDEAVSIEPKQSNFPKSLEKVFVGQAVDMARQCVQAPIRKNPKAPPFVPKPSLKVVSDFLIKDCIRRYPTEECALCKKRALPTEPKDCVTNPKDAKFVERVYCSHLFHFTCLDEYMKTPPFTGGKKCPVCGNTIYHDRWQITPKLAEERWAHKEAKNRELSEVVDFLGDCT
ncbi:uncharacterized protein LOC116300360 isoform X1 [Actinia tenebrosa]|uniref:Uncharacterized protein LOC116300360 isoform X1 n=1 Tax=Actinia tenebrosa TaxID=6105 RepID=A0A6P8IAD7_ACTTE|nr:uncharacterized protein LOC116300360 isoform X1 [Actinia tenebrosa]